MVTFTLFCFLYSHPSLAAYSSRSVCLEGLKQSWCRQGAGYTERSCGLHAAKTCAVPSGMFTQHATSSDIQPTFSLPCSCFHVSAGVGDVHSCTAAVSQREWRQVEEIIQTDCRRHTSHDCQAAGRKLFASLYVGLTLMLKPTNFYSNLYRYVIRQFLFVSVSIFVCLAYTDASGLSRGIRSIKHSVWDGGTLLSQTCWHAAQEYVHHPSHHGETSHQIACTFSQFL